MPLPPDVHRFRPHPWHGLDAGPDAPGRVRVYVEITPFSTVKYEVDKRTGYLAVDRPQSMNALPPGPYGFVPGTWCGPQVAALAGTERGDGDPLDICVISERPVDQADVLLSARVVGGLLMIDDGEADDKILAVLDRDPLWHGVGDVTELPPGLVDRWRHYFQTYKLGVEGDQPVRVAAVYGAGRAEAVVRAAMADYAAEYGVSPR